MDPRVASQQGAGPGPSALGQGGPQQPQPQPGIENNPKTRALRTLEPKIADMSRMIDHLVYMVQYQLHENSWPDFLNHYQLFQSKMTSLLESLLSPTGVGNFLKVLAVVPKIAPPQHPVHIMLEGHVPELTTEARALLDEAEYDPGFDISFQLNRLEDELRAMRDAMHRVVGPPDSTDVSGVKSVLTKRKAPGSAPATPISDAAILGPKSKLRRDVAEFDVAGGGGQTGTGRSPAGPVNVVPPGVPPLLAHKVPGAHVLTEAQRGQLMALLKCVDM